MTKSIFQLEIDLVRTRIAKIGETFVTNASLGTPNQRSSREMELKERFGQSIRFEEERVVDGFGKVHSGKDFANAVGGPEGEIYAAIYKSDISLS